MNIKKISDAIVEFFFLETPTVRLDLFRIVMGSSLLFYMIFRWQWATEWLTPEGFHVSPENLPYHDFIVPLLPSAWLPFFGFIFFGSLIAFILGWQLRITSWLTLAGLVYVTAADQLSAFSPNKVFIVATSVLCCAPWAGPLSFSRHKTRMCLAWPVRILQMTIVIHLFMAGWTKICFGEWLFEPNVLWSQIQGTYRTDFAAFMLKYVPRPYWTLMQMSALLFELFTPFLFIRPKLRTIAVIWGGGFQLMIAATMEYLIFFNLLIISFFVLFLDKNRLDNWTYKLVKPVKNS